MPITFKKGDMFNESAHAYVCTVNSVGVMGKGVALECKNRYPKMFKLYKEACLKGEIRPGRVWVWSTPNPHNLTGSNIKLWLTYIVCVATKDHWQSPSQLQWIVDGVAKLRQFLEQYAVHGTLLKIVVPPLGCGNGGLRWSFVKPIIEKGLNDLPNEIIVMEP